MGSLLNTMERRFPHLTAFDAIGEGVAVHDRRTGAFLDVNARMCELHGYARDEFVQLGIEDIRVACAPDRADEARHVIQKAATAGPQEARWCYRRKDGTLFPVKVCLRAAVLEGEECVVATVRDLNEAETAGSGMHTRERLQDVLQKLPVYVFEQDRDLRYTWVSGTVTGTDPETIQGKRDDVVLQMLLPEEAEQLEGAKRRVLATGRPVRAEMQGTFGGTRRIYDTYLTPLRDGAGNVTGLLGTMLDITERKQASAEEQKNERRYRQLFEAAQDGILISSPDHEIVDINPAGLEILGHSRDELEHIDPLGFYVDIEQVRRGREIIREKGVVRDLELRLRRKDGSEIVCQVTASAQHDAAGNLEAYYTIFRDITAQRRQTEQFQFLTQEVSDYAICMLDPEGRVVTWNAGAEKIKGYTEAEILGRPWSTFYPRADAEAGRPARALETARHAGRWSGEGWRVRKDGRRFWARVTMTALRGTRGELRGFVEMTHDLTEHKEREEALAQQVQRAERKNTLLRLMQAVASAANDTERLEEALQTAIEVVCEHVDWPIGHVYRRAEEGDRLVSTELWYTHDAVYCERFKAATAGLSLARGEGLPGRVLASGEPAWIADVLDDPDFARAQRADDLEVRGAFAFPVRAGGEVVAVLEFFAPAPQVPDERLLETMASVGVQLGRVAEREAARKALRTTEARYRRLFEEAQEGISIVAPGGDVLAVNPAGQAILGYSEDELQVMRDEDLYVHPDERRNILERLTADGALRDFEVQVRRKGGEEIVLLLSSTAQRGPDGEIAAFQTFFRDITEKKRAEAALRESEEKFRALAEESPIGVCLIQEDGFQYVNKAYAEIFGYDREEMIDTIPVEAIIHPDDRHHTRENVRKRLAGEMSDAHYQVRGVTKGQKVIYVDLYGRRCIYQGKPTIVGTAMDVTRQRRLEEDLLRIQEEERRRFGHDLHDGVASDLTGVALITSSLARKVERGKSVTPEELREVVAFINEGIEEARALSRGLSPAGLEHGLAPALEGLAERTRAHGELACMFEATGPLPELSEETATHLYRIAQEAVGNAIKHAQSDRIWIRLRATGEALILVVRDDGRESADPAQWTEGLGMRTMSYRANLTGSTLRIEEAPDGGAVVRCRLPVTRERVASPGE